jgi:tetratricopeptide (TPR) repeat protein
LERLSCEKNSSELNTSAEAKLDSDLRPGSLITFVTVAGFAALLECALMRPIVTPLVCFAALSLYASGEVIHLKNGRTIWADQVRQNGKHLEYEVGEGAYAIPLSAVDHVEAGGIAPQAVPSQGNAKAQAQAIDFTPASDLQYGSELIERVIRDGRVDPDGLRALESEGNTSTTAAGYFVAANREMENANFTRARSYFESALRFSPQNPAILNYYATLLVRTGNPVEALSYAERAVRLAPESPDTLAVLGYAQFAADHNHEAIRAWKRSLELRPDARVQKYLEKAEREEHAEADFSQRESSHFILRYEGRETSESFRRELVSVLDSDYDDLVRQLGVAPRSSIPVVLYTETAFFDVTQSPSWVSAMNDGKLRIPVSGVASVTPALARVLKHELAHSFINQLSVGRCPQWMNEGIAQLLEPKTLSGRGSRLSRTFQEHADLPFNTLESSFIRFSPQQAVLAYDESLAVVEYINETYGISDVQRILQRLGEGSSTETALRTTIHTDYGRLRDEVANYLATKYGQ